MLMEEDLPNDVEALRALVLEQARELDALKVFQAEVERLKAIIEALQRHRFDRRSEQLDPGQFELALEEVETALVEAQHAVDKASRASADRLRKANRGSLPAHLERIEQVVDVEDKACPCCGGVNGTVKIPGSGKVKFPTLGFGGQVVGGEPPFLGGRPRRRGSMSAGGVIGAFALMCSGRRSAWRRRR